MKIDIISFAEEQYATLTAAQLLEVATAQARKDRLTRKLEKDLHEIKGELIKNGTYNSSIYQNLEAEKRAAYDKEVELVRDMLLFYLRYSMRYEGTEGTAPYTINYALSDEKRFEIVRDYYLETYENAGERFEAFKGDIIAPQYLGEMYAPLFDYFKALA